MLQLKNRGRHHQHVNGGRNDFSGSAGSFFNQDVFAFAEQHENKSADKSQNDREFFDCSAYLADMQKSFPLSFYQNSVPKKA